MQYNLNQCINNHTIMKEITEKKYPLAHAEIEINNLPGYPLYPATEDIYCQCKEEREINPEDVLLKKEYEVEGTKNAKDGSCNFSGDDLDIPGAELDDKQEAIGSEDKENNYYSLGGDNHDDLEENTEKA